MNYGTTGWWASCIFQSAIANRWEKKFCTYRFSTQIFRSVKHADSIAGWLQTAFTYTAMVDYPTPANFLMDLPAYPVKEVLHFTCPNTSPLLPTIFPSICINKNRASVPPTEHVV